MYLGKKEFYSPEEYERDRVNNLKYKNSAVWLAFFELDGLINKTQLAAQYFKRTHAWLSQKLNGCTLHKVKYSFTETEYHQLAEAFRDIAKRLMAHADEIDAAASDTEND